MSIPDLYADRLANLYRESLHFALPAAVTLEPVLLAAAEDTGYTSAVRSVLVTLDLGALAERIEAEPDTAGSASRQHYIDTGRYLDRAGRDTGIVEPAAALSAIKRLTREQPWNADLLDAIAVIIEHTVHTPAPRVPHDGGEFIAK